MTYNEGHSRNEREEESRSSRSQVGNDDFCQEHDHGVTDLVDDGSTAECRDSVRGGFNDRSDDVEDDTDDDKFESTENIADLGGSGLSSGGNDGSENVDGGKQ